MGFSITVVRSDKHEIHDIKANFKIMQVICLYFLNTMGKPYAGTQSFPEYFTICVFSLTFQTLTPQVFQNPS